MRLCLNAGGVKGMATNRRCAAVYAGLLGTNLLVAPSNCYAISLESVKQEVLYGYYSPIVFGLAAGVATGALMARLNKTSKNNAKAQVKTNSTHTSNKASQRSVEGGFSYGVDTPTTSSYVPKHARVTSWDMTGNIRVQKPIENLNFTSDDTYQSVFNAQSDTPVETEDKKYSVADTSTSTTSTTDVDYEDVAQSYVKKQEDKKRNKVRSFGVGRVLAERLGFASSDIMEGIPVIQRADGSVGDVGTSWWDEAIEDSDMKASKDFSDYLGIDNDWTAAHPLNITSTDPGTTAASIFVQVAPEVATYPNTVNTTTTNTDTVRTNTAARVVVEPTINTEPQAQRQVVNPMYANKQTETTHAVPHVEQEKYPVNDEYKYASREDIWQMALDALDEKIETPAAQDDMFEDIVGNIDTIDDPTGLEPKTSFIPFRTPAGHPEVVDTESYIDYLIRDEFAKVKSHSVRRNAREYLKVIEGGTSTHNMYIPSHMQQSVQAL